MFKNIFKFKLIALLFAVVFGLLISPVRAANNGTVIIKTGKTAYAVGETFTAEVNVKISSGKLGAVVANLGFDSSLLQYISVKESKDFDETLEKKTPPETPGLVHLVRGKLGGISSSDKVYNVYNVDFKVLKAGQTKLIIPLSVLVDSNGANMTALNNSISLNLGNTGTVTTPNLPGSSFSDTVTATPTPAAAGAPTISLLANDAVDLTVQSNESFNLKWSSTGALSCVSNWAGDKATEGEESMVIIEGGTYTYDLTCLGQNDVSNSAQATVTVVGSDTIVFAQEPTSVATVEETNSTPAITTAGYVVLAIALFILITTIYVVIKRRSEQE